MCERVVRRNNNEVNKSGRREEGSERESKGRGERKPRRWASEQAKERLRKGEEATVLGTKKKERGREGEKKRTERRMARTRE